DGQGLSPMSSAITIPIYLLVALAAMVAAGKSVEPAYAVHAYIIIAACFGAIGLTIRAMKFAPDGRLIRLAAREDRYDDDVIRAGVIATVFWAVVGFAAGLFIALQLAFPQLNIGEMGTFGRVRPVHTTVVIFGFCGSALIASSFYVVQRTCRARLAFGSLAWFVFWGYQLFLVLSITGYFLGITQSKEYAEPEWYADILLAVVWVAYLAIFIGTIVKRSEPHIYVANWFYLSFIITVAMLHIVNNLAVPAGWSGKSYSLFAGVQDALTQWWY